MSEQNKSYDYTVAMANLNNADTLRESILSIYNQVNDNFEILIVDDGSTDGSLEILKQLEENYHNIRLVIGDNKNLAEARNQLVYEAKGEYILESMDPDDRYNKGVMDFVEIFDQINKNFEKDFYLKGKGINIAPKKLLLEYQYRSLGYGEDRDLWRRLFPDNIIWLEHELFCEVIREDYSTIEKLHNFFEATVVDFRGGISFVSFIRYCLVSIHKHPKKNIFRLLIALIAYLTALDRGRYSPPSDKYQRMGELEKAINSQSLTLSELENEYNINIDRAKLSEEGKRIFFCI